jgi:hypothetical protein
VIVDTMMFAVRASILMMTNMGVHVVWYATCENCGREVADAIYEDSIVDCLRDHLIACTGKR